jgi:hypothetical protein
MAADTGYQGSVRLPPVLPWHWHHCSAAQNVCYTTQHASAGIVANGLQTMWPTLGNNSILITMSRRVAMSGLMAPHRAWPSPHACLAQVLNEMRP